MSDGYDLVAIILHARSVPSGAREAFAEGLGPFRRSRDSIVLHTCHRVELYATAGAAAALAGTPVPGGGRRLAGRDAVRHLMTVAAGLDSAVVGEDQLLHQIRECLTEHNDRTPLGPILQRAFQVALRVGREARAWREGPPRSLADVAFDRIAALRGPSGTRSALVVGAGQMGALAARTAARRELRVLVANRSADRAATLARAVAGDAVSLDLADPPFVPDGVVVAIRGRWSPGPAAADALVEGGAAVVDLSSPVAVEPLLQERLGERFVSVDMLARAPETASTERLRRRLGRVVDAGVEQFDEWLRVRSSVPVIQAIAERAEARRSEELERLLGRLPALRDDERALLDQMTQRLVGGILHAPLTALRDDASGARARVARELFGV